MTVKTNDTAHRFEIEVDNQVGVLEYYMQGNSIVFTHTGVPPEIEGRGIANALAKAGLEHARTHGLKVVPQCAFMRYYLAKHPEYKDLVD